jgi:imidazolonepropionase-like amidohydrolase
VTDGLLHVVGTDPATRQPVEHWIAGGVFVEAPRDRGAAAATLTGWITPGFVDAHCHVGYSRAGVVTLDEAQRQARTNLAAGVTAIRDCGSPLDTSSLVGRPDLPVLVRAGRHVARPKRYIRGLGVDLDDPAELPAEVARQAAAGGGWVKLVGDWIDRSVGDLAPLWPDAVLVEAVAAAHAAGARVTAHVFGSDAVPGLLAAGIDCLEHGTGLTDSTVDEMVRRGVHLVPTLINVANFPAFAEAADRYPTYAAHMRDLHARAGATLAAAIEAGVPVHAGTDAGGYIDHGRIVDEVYALSAVPGRTGAEVLDAATWQARRWLGLPEAVVGAEADLVVYPVDVAAQPGALHTPTAVVRAGRIVAGRDQAA